MGVLGFLKRKKGENLDDIRSSVLGEPRELEPPPEEPPMEPSEREVGRPRFRDMEEPVREPMTLEPISAPTLEPVGQENRDNNFEIMDRLRFIENQLATIRSQVELANERLKNLEGRLGRRY